MLRAIAYGWRQEDVAANAQAIASAGREVYSRLATFVEKFQDIGTALERSNKAYNAAVGSLERNLLPGARRFKSLNVTADADVESPTPIEIEVRPIVAPELQLLPFVKTADGEDDSDADVEPPRSKPPVPQVTIGPAPAWNDPAPSHLL
jgi:DNA recombination protein RmuC